MAEKINKSVLDYIAKEINLSVSRLGINTQLSIVEVLDYAGRPLLKMVGTPFQTMPVIFREINIEGFIRVRPSSSDEQVMEVNVPLEYRYTTFDDGQNGHTLGSFTFEIDKEIWDTWDGHRDSFIRYGIRKVAGLIL